VQQFVLSLPTGCEYIKNPHYMRKLFDGELPLLQVYVYDLNVNKYEPLCEQSGEFNNNCLSGI